MTTPLTKLHCANRSEDFAHSARYRLDVVATEAVEMVSGIGGWLFDLVKAGWDVKALAPKCAELRGLSILGVDVGNFEHSLRNPDALALPRAIAVATQAYDTDDRIRRGVHLALDDSRIAVILWGGTCPHDLRSFLTPASHQPSAAANVFRDHALKAIRTAHKTRALTETFHTTQGTERALLFA
ncbi:hypothetical protein MAAFP003_4768 [Mycobacterium ahvazicum]|uniref:Uncharacterized protein n=1 Tax=Mycobacterium ahvazicum TaxID=1964395 RepID=A0A2K4YH10_9MYCO|nr:hypothetical protein [Mycobacterium ahvazicum]SOX56072.1 hypothetical protein MAAFP003_4768 [Mycobacterium ahvazicum]